MVDSLVGGYCHVGKGYGKLNRQEQSKPRLSWLPFSVASQIMIEDEGNPCWIFVTQPMRRTVLLVCAPSLGLRLIALCEWHA
jgi:hypothetical protein